MLLFPGSRGQLVLLIAATAPLPPCAVAGGLPGWLGLGASAVASLLLLLRLEALILLFICTMDLRQSGKINPECRWIPKS